MNMFKKRGILGNDQRRQDKATSVQQQQQIPRGGGQPLQQQRSPPPNGRMQQSQSHQTREHLEYEHTPAVSSAGLVVDSRTSSDISSEEKNNITAPPALPKHQSNHSQTSLGAPSTTSINGGGGNSTLTSNNNNSSGTLNNLNNNDSNSNNENSKDNNGSNNGSSSNKKKNDKVVGKRSDFLKGQVDSLTESNRRLEHDNNKLKAKLEEQRIDLQRRYEDSQRLLRFKEEEFVKMQNNFHKHVRAIRATDDDLSTIHSKLTMLQAKTGQLTMSLRVSYNETKFKEVIDYFKKKWPTLSETIDQLTQQSSKLDYPLVCLFVEKLVMEILIEQIFNTPIQMGLSINQHFKVLSDHMNEQQYHEWSTKLRQQLCKLTLKSKDLQNEASIAKSEIVQRIKQEMNPIYTFDDAKILPKLDKIVSMAAETSLAMHGQDEPVIFGNDLIEGKSMFDPKLMTLQYGSTMNIPQQQPSSLSKIDNNNSNTELNQQKENTDDKDNDKDKLKTTIDDDKNENKNEKEIDEDSDDDDDDDDDDDYNTVQDPTSPIPTPNLVLRVIISPVVYGGDGNGNLTSLLPARVICT